VKAKVPFDLVNARFDIIECASRSQEEERRSFDRNTSQSSRAPCGSVDVDSIVPDIRMRHRRMTMHDESSVTPRRVEELITNPNQIIGILMLNRDIRANAGVHEQEIAATELIAQASHDQIVCTGKRVNKVAMQVEGCLVLVAQLDAVRCKRLHPAQLQPVRQERRVLKEPLHHSFVVAAQTHCAMDNESHREQIEHRPGVRSAIDVVAEIDLNSMCDRSAPYVVVDSRGDLAQQIGPAVNVADRIDACAGGR